MSERYYLSEVSGFPNAGLGSTGGGFRAPGVSFSILDAYDCHREVATDYGGRHRGSLSVARRRQLMARQCLSLNADDAA